MNEESAKTKKEIGVGGYFLRILAFWVVFVLGMGAFLLLGGVCGGLLGAPKIAAGAGAFFFWAGLVALWTFPTFCVDALNPRPILATAISALVLTLFGGAAVLCGNEAASKPDFWGKAPAVAVFLLYVAWLVFKLLGKSVYATARRLRWSIFTAIGVPAVFGALALASVLTSGAVPNMGPGARAFGVVFGLPTLCAYWTSAAVYGAFACLLSIAEEAKGGAKEVESADV